MPEPLIDTARMVPRGLKRSAYRLIQPLIEGVLGVRAFNRYYTRLPQSDASPAQFCEAGLAELGVRWMPDPETLAQLRAVQGPCVVVANHPLGAREAGALFAILGRARADFRVMSNFVMGGLPLVRPGLILVDPFETKAATAANLRPIREARAWLKDGGLLGVFPAGEVSVWREDEGRIADKDWAGQTARLIQSSRATVVPLRFFGRNRRCFYLAGRLHPRLRTALLVREFLFGPTQDLGTRIGAPIPFEELPDLPAADLAAWLRSRVYAL